MAGGTATWSSTGNYTGTQDGVYASGGVIGSGVVTQSLDAYNFNPGVPGGSTITGFQYVGIYKRGSVTTRFQQINSHTLTINGSSVEYAFHHERRRHLATNTTDTTVTWGAVRPIYGE